MSYWKVKYQPCKIYILFSYEVFWGAKKSMQRDLETACCFFFQIQTRVQNSLMSLAFHCLPTRRVLLR